MMPRNLAEPWTDDRWVELTQRIAASYRHWTGELLVAEELTLREQAKQLFLAPFIVAAHNAESDPIFCYGNQAALDLWEIALPDFLQLPSRRTAQPDARPERQAMLQRGLAEGMIADYAGVRISTQGKLFHIERAKIWNVLDESGERMGQAVMFRDWHYLPAAVET